MPELPRSVSDKAIAVPVSGNVAEKAELILFISYLRVDFRCFFMTRYVKSLSGYAHNHYDHTS